jgi:hypothetical protein
VVRVQVLDAYATGVEAFKELKTRYGLTEDSIDDTMIKIQEVRTFLAFSTVMNA